MRRIGRSTYQRIAGIAARPARLRPVRLQFERVPAAAENGRGALGAVQRK